MYILLLFLGNGTQIVSESKSSLEIPIFIMIWIKIYVISIPDVIVYIKSHPRHLVGYGLLGDSEWRWGSILCYGQHQWYVQG